MKTVLSRYNYLIELRKKNIRHMERILEGKNRRYKYDLEAVQRKLTIEKQCLNELLTDAYYQKILNNERMETLEKYIEN